ncbi:MAG TPA: rhodanese-like domain-containing protein [Polyangiaceae bacterium]
MTVTTKHQPNRQRHAAMLVTVLQLGALGAVSALGCAGCEDKLDACNRCGDGGNVAGNAGASTSVTGGNAGAGGAYGGERNESATAGTSGTFACSGWSALERLTPVEFHDVLETSDPILINVHTPYEGELPGTDASIPYTDVDSIEQFVQRDHCADILLTCLGGGMSVSAGNALVQRGYLRVRDLQGGMNAWKAAGYPLKPAPAGAPTTDL